MNIKALFATVYLLTVAGVLANVAIAAETNRSQTITRAGSQPSVKGSAEYFTGNVRVDPLFPANETASFSGAYVTFEPGARSAWHIHPKGQHLLVTAGVGRTGEWEGKVDEITSPAIDKFLKGHLFGDIFGRDNLDFQSREIATISALASMTGVNAQLQSHFNVGLNVGLTQAQMKSLISMFELKVGKKEADNASAVLEKVIAARSQK